MRANYSAEADAMAVELVPQGERSGEYYLLNKGKSTMTNTLDSTKKTPSHGCARTSNRSQMQ